MTIQLPEDTERSILAAIRSGHFSSVDSALAAAWLAYANEARITTVLQPPTPDDVHRQMLAAGLLTRLPDPAQDRGDDDEPVTVEGEPLSATITRERR